MREHPATGVMPAYVAERRRLALRALSEAVGVAEAEVRRVLDGAAPGPAVPRRLAPVLRLREVDLFVLAGLEVPQDLAPLDIEARGILPGLVIDAIGLEPERRRMLHELVRSLPREDRAAPFAPTWPASFPGGPAARIMRMFVYRNLHPLGIAKVLAWSTPSYLSASTYAMVGNGRAGLTPRLVVDCAAVLGMDAGMLAALAGVELREEPGAPGEAAVYAGSLLWDARRLTAEQLRPIADLARSLRRERADRGAGTEGGAGPSGPSSGRIPPGAMSRGGAAGTYR